MPKQAVTAVSVYGSNRDMWRQDDSYGFTHSSVDYGVGVCGMTQDKPAQVARMAFRKITAVLGKTEAQRQAAVADIATIKTALPGLTDTDPVAEPVLSTAQKAAITAAITDGSIDIILNGHILTISELGVVTGTEV